MVSGSGSGEWRVKGRLLTSVQYYSTIKGPLETLEMLNLRLYPDILSSLTQTGEGTIYRAVHLFLLLCQARFYLKFLEGPWYLTFHAWPMVDIYCVTPGGFFNIWWELTSLFWGTIVVLNQCGFYALYFLYDISPYFSVTIILFCHFVEGYYWQQSPYYPRSAVCCHLNGENRFPPPQSPYDIHHYNYPRS